MDNFQWTPALDKQLLELRLTGMTIADMGTYLGCGKRKVGYRLEVLKPPRLKHPTWTDERVEYVKMHYPAGLKTAEQIGLDLGLTKNQVIGKVGRLGLKHGTKPEAALFEAKPYVGGPSVKFAPATGCQYHDDAKGWCGKRTVIVTAWRDERPSPYCKNHHQRCHYGEKNSSYRHTRPHLQYRLAT